MNMGLDVSVVIPAHKEGRMARHTLQSAIRAIAFAEKTGISSEILVVMDSADENTVSFLDREKAVVSHVEMVEYRDLGLTRNHGVRKAHGKYVAFLDADNLFCESWLSHAWHYLESRNEDVIAHPEYVVTFEAASCIWCQISSDAASFRGADFIENNFWDATCMAKRSLLLSHPYEPTTSTRGFGYEDWHFNCETLAAGIPHHVIPDTALFLRKKHSGSLLAFTNETRRVIRSSRLFSPEIFRNLLK